MNNQLQIPAIGQYWPNQGGVYAGVIRDGDRQWHLIQCVSIAAVITAKWGKYGETIEGEFSRRDGQHNTQLILAAEPENEIATHISNLEIDGHKDFYWPAQHENNLLCTNLPELGSQDWHWSSTQYSAHGAWYQNFGDGYSVINSKGNSLAARAVRRLTIE